MSDRPRSRFRRWISLVARLVVCVAAAAYLYTKVSWYDHVTLHADPLKTYRLLNRPNDDPLHLEDAGSGGQFTVPRSALAAREDLAHLRQRPIETGLRSAIREMNVDWALVALLALAPTTFILAWRLRYLLAMQQVHISFYESVMLTFAGNFFNFALPGTTGGDIYKAYHVARHAHRRTEAVTIVFLDRVIGLVNFVLLAGVCILLSWRQSAIGSVGKLVGLLLAGTVIGALIFFSKRFRRWIGYERLLARLPMADRLRRVDQTAFSLRYHPRRTAVALAITTLNNAFLALMILALARALGMPADRHPMTAAEYASLFLASTLALTVGYLVAAVPVSVQGFGLLETVFLRVLAGQGWGTSSQVIALCLGARAVQLAWSLPGIVVPWLGFGRPPPSEAEQFMTDPEPLA